MRKLLTLNVLCLCIVFAGHAQQRLSSPDGRYLFSVDRFTYTITFNGQNIIGESRLGVNIDNRLNESALAVPRGENDEWIRDFRLKSVEHTTVDSTWTPLYGENARIRDHYNQLILHYEKGGLPPTPSPAGDGNLKGEKNLKDEENSYDRRKFYGMDIIVRAYNEGIAFRYHFPETTNNLFLHLIDERTSFRLPNGTMAWYEEWAQGPYQRRPLVMNDEKSKMESNEGKDRSEAWLEAERPLLLELPDGTYVALLEATLRDYARGKFTLRQDNELQVKLFGNVDLITPYDTPWRVVMAARRPVELINNKELVLNLNDDLQMTNEAFSWVRPGRAFRSTRLDKASIFRSIDFCATFGIEYIELDAGWYGPEGKVESDARHVSQERDFTIPEVCNYARSKGIGVWLYVNQRALTRQLDELLPLYREWGVRGIKFGFVQVGSQHWTTWLHEAVAKCAKHELMVDIHDEYRPTGLSRTWPNLLTQEGVRGNEEMPDATHNVLLPFTRYLCGPADYTLCYFNNRVKNTHGHQLAMAAVYYSPLQFLFWYDTPFPEGWNGEELQFWRECPTTFDESCCLDGIPGEYIVQARRSGSDWFVGVMNGKDGRTVTINTDFLRQGKYTLTIYHDDLTLSTRSKVGSKTMNIRAGKTIDLSLLPSGGAALYFRRQ